MVEWLPPQGGPIPPLRWKVSNGGTIPPLGWTAINGGKNSTLRKPHLFNKCIVAWATHGQWKIGNYHPCGGIFPPLPWVELIPPCAIGVFFHLKGGNIGPPLKVGNSTNSYYSVEYIILINKPCQFPMAILHQTLRNGGSVTRVSWNFFAHILFPLAFHLTYEFCCPSIIS